MNRFFKDFTEGLFAAFLFLSLIFGFALICNGAERAENFSEAYGAACRVFNGNTAGSGTCFLQDSAGNCYILTNFHVAQKNNCRVQFFYNGSPQEVEGEYVESGYSSSKSIDYTILKIPADKAKGVVFYYVPLWLKDDISGEEDCLMATTGAPAAKWLRTIRGRIRCDNTGGNWTFRPTPYGGQSGSSIIIEKNGLPYICALLTWRAHAEGMEDFGGLAQPIKRVLTSMKGEAAAESLPDVPLPVGAVPCPGDSAKEAKEKPENVIILGTGEAVIPCATTIAPVSVEVWTMQGCAPCAAAKKYGVPKWKEMGGVKIRDASGNDRFNATANGITQFPTIRLLDAGGSVLKTFVGYNTVIDAQVTAALKKYNVQAAVPVQDILPPVLEDLTCGRSNLWDSIIGNDDEYKNKDKKGDAENAPPIVEEEPPESNKERGGLFGGGLIGRAEDSIKADLSDFFADMLNQYENKAKAAIFWLAFLACTLALLCYSTIKAGLSAVFACFRWGFKKVKGFVQSLGRKSLSAIAEAVNKERTKEEEGNK